MLFKTRFHAGIRDGSIDVTFRIWKRPQAVAGRRYRIGGLGEIEVESVDQVVVGALDAPDARSAGFDSLTELVEVLRSADRERGLTKRSKVYRVCFRWIGDGEEPRVALGRDASAAALAAVAERLARMDRLSRRGAWTHQVLELIACKPRIAASQLAPELDRETRSFKADVRKLKELGLTESFEVGYGLTARGRAAGQEVSRIAWFLPGLQGRWLVSTGGRKARTVPDSRCAGSISS